MMKLSKFHLLGTTTILVIFALDLSNYNVITTVHDPHRSTGTTPALRSSSSISSNGSTKIIAITDIQYSEIALDWYQKLSNLGYTNHFIIATDDESLSFFHPTTTTTNNDNDMNTKNSIRVEPIIDPTSSSWPIAAGKPQQLRRRIFATRWVYILGQLKNGHHILLTDADNIFLRYMPMSIMETSDYDVYHSYCANFPVNFLSMGFVVCGGMMWLRSSMGSIHYVESILEQCGWDGMEDDADDGGTNTKHNGTTTTMPFHSPEQYPPPVLPMKAKAAKCDDQQVINHKFFFNTLNYTWDDNEHRHGQPKVEDGFWKMEASGKSFVTGHTFKLWDVDTCYRGTVDGSTEGRCPVSTVNWVAMPLNSIITNDADKHLDAAGDRRLRKKQWYRFCRNETE